MSWFFSPKDKCTGVNIHSATAPLHFVSDHSRVAKAYLQLLSHHHTIISQARSFATSLLCNSLDSSPAKTHLQTKNANVLFAEILMDEKIITTPLLFCCCHGHRKGIKASKPSISWWWIKEIINLSYKKAGCVSAINVRGPFMRGISASWAEKAKASAYSPA